MKKGQYVRLMMGNKCWAAAMSCTLHISAQVEESSTKDTDEGSWVDNDVVGLSWDANVEALVIDDSDNTANDLAEAMDAFEDQDTTEYTLELCATKGTMNRTADTVLASGLCKITEVSISAPNRQNSTFTVSFVGNGPLYAGSIPSTSSL